MNFAEALKNKFTGSEGAARIQGIGLLMSQLGAGQTPNAGPALQMLEDRNAQNALKAQMQNGDFMTQFTPQEQAFLSTLPPRAAQALIADRIFAQPAPVQGTDDMREYEFARAQGFGGSFVDFMTQQRAAGATQINNNLGPTGIDYGDPGSGRVWQRDAQGNIVLDDRGAPVAIMFQGGAAYDEATASLAERASGAIDAAEAAAGKDALEERAGRVVIEDIGRLKTLVEEAPWYSPAIGFGSGLFESVRGSNAADALALANTIRGNIGFDRLQQMRDASPTGGALGQVSEQELATLQAVLGSLEASQSEEQFVENLDRLGEIYTGIMTKFSAYPNAAEFGMSGTAGAPPPAKRLVYNPETGEFE